MALFAFLDESGEFVFRPQAGNYLVFAAVVTPNPLLFNQELHEAKYELMKQGHILERFHAAEDKQFIRDRVFQILSSSKEYSIHSVVVRKNRVNPVLHRYGVYSIAYRTLLRYLVGGGRVKEIHLIVDTVPDKRHQTVLMQTLEQRAKEAIETRNIPYTLCHHNSAAHVLLQAADYCAWAIYKKWHAGDRRAYDLIRGRITNEYDIFLRGDQDYY